MTAAPSQPSPGQTRLGSDHSGLLSPARSTDTSGDFARLLSLDLSPSGRIGASPQRRPSGMLRSTEPTEKPASDGGNAERRDVQQAQSAYRDVTVLLTVHPNDSMAWVTVELVATRKGRHAGQPMHPDRSPAADQAVSDGVRAAPDNDEEAAAGHVDASKPAVGSSGASAPHQSVLADVESSATEAADAAAQAGSAAPPVDDWVAALPAVPKLPIRLDTAAAAAKAARGAAATEPSYADLTAQLAGSSTDASASSAGSEDDEESETAVSEDEADRERDPRRELELDMAVADALAQVNVDSRLPTW